MRYGQSTLLTGILLLGFMANQSAAGNALGESAEVMFPAQGVSGVKISPQGTWISAVGTLGRVHGLLVQRSGRPPVEPIIASENPLLESSWVSDDTLIARFATQSGHRYLIARIIDEETQIRVNRSWVAAIGWLVDPLPLVDNEVLWAFEYKDESALHRVTLDQLRSFREERRTGRGRYVLPGVRLATISGLARNWIVDRNGVVRSAIRYLDDGYEVHVFRSGGRASRVVRAIEDRNRNHEKFVPVAVSADQKKLIVLAYHDRDTVGLYEFDPRTDELGERIFGRFDVDISGVLLEFHSGTLIAAIYEADGDPRYHYFDEYRELFGGQIAAQFPTESIQVVGSSVDRRQFVFRVSSATNPGVYYYRNASANHTQPIATQSSSIDRNRLVEVENFVVASSDGLEIEAFLASPTNVGPSGAPLVVMPHGGPIGVRDNKRYDPFVQYLATWGFAVLQPNYRGSEGYGTRFKEAGKKQWAERIEDDIDAAVEWAMVRPDIDPERICIIGSSYGGFSALASIVRHQDRYRCAISWNGVSDIPLLYDSSDGADSKRAMAYHEEYVGDIETERDKLVAASPAYHVDQIETPVLVLYGDEDRRVDPDHAHRMLLMFETLGKEHESIEIKGMGHSYSRAEGVLIARAMRRFLTRYLMPDQPMLSDPEISTDRAPRILPKIRLER